MLDKTHIQNKPVLSPRSFWDINYSALDFERYSDFTIIRVLERGTEKDIEEIVHYYGAQKIIQTLCSAKSLLPRALLLGKKLFQLTNDKFECLKHLQQEKNYSMF